MCMFEGPTSLVLSPLLPTGTMLLPVPISLLEAGTKGKVKAYIRVLLGKGPGSGRGVLRSKTTSCVASSCVDKKS